MDRIKKSASDEVTDIYTYDVDPEFDPKASMAPPKRRGRRSSSAAVGPDMEPIRFSVAARMQRGQRGTRGRNNAELVRIQSKMAVASMMDEESNSSQEDAHVQQDGKHSANKQSTAQAGSTGVLSDDAPEIVLPPFKTDIWKSDVDLVTMRIHMSEKIYSTWNSGMQLFIEGNWDKAREMFRAVLNITNGKDGPSLNILRHIEQDYGGIKPDDWKGYRDLS